MSRTNADFLMHLVNSVFAGIGLGVVLLIVTDSCRQHPDVMPATPNVGAPEHSQPSARPFPWVQPGNKPNNGPSYPDRRPADRIDGETILNVSHDRVRDRSPP